mgnify:CR=1 FL=1
MLIKLEPSDQKLNLITLNGHALNQTNSGKIVGLETDEKLNFSTHVDQVCKKLASRVGVLNKIKVYLPTKQRILYYNATIRPLLNYVNASWLERCS